MVKCYIDGCIEPAANYLVCKKHRTCSTRSPLTQLIQDFLTELVANVEEDVKSKSRRGGESSRRPPHPAPLGYKWCKRCGNFKPVNTFRSAYARRDKTTTYCAPCRKKKEQSRNSSKTSRGKCRMIWQQWRDNNKCVMCGTSKHIEADHIDPLQKVYSCSQYSYWASHGGEERLRHELTKCRALCTFCHRIHSMKQRNKSKCATRLKKRSYVNNIKRKIGACSVCSRRIENDDQLCAFDFDHKNQKEHRAKICQMVQNYSLSNFFQYIDLEISRCRLVCCMCHRTHTNLQRRLNQQRNGTFYE